jgi:uroporphyrinogen-III decarboxylase
MRDAGYVITATIPGGFDEVRVLMGAEGVLYAPYTHPELVQDILDTTGDTAARTLELVTRDITIDQLFVHEDMAGKGGPLWGPRQVQRFMVPYYRKCWDVVQSRGGRLFNIDSDGDCNAILDSLILGGINMFDPCEPAANMDVVAIRAKYGTRLALEGGIDKFALLEGEEAIDKELERVVPPMVHTGGCVLSLDHRIPNGVTLQGYRYYIRRLQAIIAREGGSSPCADVAAAAGRLEIR